MEVLKRGIPRFEVLRETHAQREKPFKKACGSSENNINKHKSVNSNNLIINHQEPLCTNPDLSFSFFTFFYVLRAPPPPSPFILQYPLSPPLHLSSHFFFKASWDRFATSRQQQPLPVGVCFLQLPDQHRLQVCLKKNSIKAKSGNLLVPSILIW